MLNNQRVFSKKHLILIPFAIILIILFISCDKDDDSSNLIISQARLAADRAVQYIVKNTETDGRFVYRNSIDPEIQVDESYNILRHAGTIYAMCGYYDVYPNDELKAAILLAGSYLQNVAIKPLPEADNDGQSMLAVWSGPEIDMYGKDRAKLGGTGLGLVALSCIENIQPGFTSQETLESLARFIKFMQMDDGSFYSFYTPAYGGKDNSHISLFYPGEAMLGLVMLYELYPSKEWLDVVSRGLTYLGESRAGSDSIPADHWAMIASAKLLSTELQHTLEISEELIISHGIQVSTTILNKQVLQTGYSMIHGAYSSIGKISTSATCLEGLIASFSFITTDNTIKNSILSSIPVGIKFLIRAQVIDGEHVGGFTGIIPSSPPEQLDEDQMHLRSEIQIDNVQHSLSALLGYLDIISQ